ncbi:MAG: H-type small acid-soluble spore protein [Bacillota bacterium]
MDFQRAKEIVKSPNNIQVLHKDKAIWITNLDEKSQTAEVTAGPQFEEKMTVAVNELEEVHSKH